jgi:hypothetical protein
MGDLLLHTNVIWLNPPASLGKWKKEPELAAFGMYQKRGLKEGERAALFFKTRMCLFEDVVYYNKADNIC